MLRRRPVIEIATVLRRRPPRQSCAATLVPITALIEADFETVSPALFNALAHDPLIVVSDEHEREMG